MYDTVDIPATHAEAARGVARPAGRDGRRERRRADGAVPRGHRAHRGAAHRRHPPGHPRPARSRPVRDRARRSRTRASSRCSTPSCATCPRPLDVGAIEGHAVGKEDEIIAREPDKDAPLSTLAFKIVSDPHLGKLTYIRIYSGTLDDRLAGAEQHQGARRSGSARSTGCTRTSARRSRRPRAGQIVAVMGLKNTTTGDTLCGPEAPVILESMNFPAPVIRWPSSRSPRATRSGSAPPSSASPRRTRPSRSAPTRRPARPSSPAWASCTSRCWSTG